MVLKEKERSVIEDLQNQEKSCMEKYAKYAGLAKDPELKALFKELHKQEQKHYDSLGQVLSGTVPDCDSNDSAGKDYSPKATYNDMTNSNRMTLSLQQTVSEQKSWYQENTIVIFLHSVKAI